MFCLVGSDEKKMDRVVVNIAKWAVGCERRLRFTLQMVHLCKGPSLYATLIKSLVPANDLNDQLEDIADDLHDLFTSEREILDQRRGDLLEAVVCILGPRDMHGQMVIRKYECRVRNDSGFIGDDGECDIDVGFHAHTVKKMELYECKVDLDRYLSYDPKRTPPLRPTQAVEKVKYMAELEKTISECGYCSVVTFVTAAANLDRACWKLQQYPDQKLGLLGQNDIVAWQETVEQHDQLRMPS